MQVHLADDEPTRERFMEALKQSLASELLPSLTAARPLRGVWGGPRFWKVRSEGNAHVLDAVRIGEWRQLSLQQNEVRRERSCGSTSVTVHRRQIGASVGWWRRRWWWKGARGVGRWVWGEGSWALEGGLDRYSSWTMGVASSDSYGYLQTTVRQKQRQHMPSLYSTRHQAPQRGLLL